MARWTVAQPDDLNTHVRQTSYFLDAYAAEDEDLARGVWNEFGARIRHVKAIDDRNHQGSWNFWPLTVSSWLLATKEREAEQKLIRYCHRQLNRDPVKHDLWGKETLSRVYTWPVAVLALAYDWAVQNERGALRRALKDLCTAHAYTLALFSLPSRHPDSRITKLFVCAPGMRTPGTFASGEQISFITRCIMNKKPRLAVAKPGRHQSWAMRLAWAASHAYLSEEERERLWQHSRNGKHAASIVQRLGELGVTFRTTVRAWRYANGDFAALAEKNLHGSTPPSLAMSRVGGEYHCLHLHKDKMRGGSGKKVGKGTCERDNDRIRARFENAIQVVGGASETLEGTIPAPREDQELVCAVEIGPDGARLLNGEPPPPAGIVRHARAIGRLAARENPSVEKIYRHAAWITRAYESR